MNNKYVKYGGIAAVIILLLYSLISAFGFGSKPASLTNNSESKIIIPTSSGSVVIPDVTKNPVEVSGDAVAVSETSNFHIVYNFSDKSFIITLLSLPLQKSRDAAEEEFLKKTSLSPGQACQISVSVTVPFNVDETASGKNYGLSFCPASLALPGN